MNRGKGRRQRTFFCARCHIYLLGFGEITVPIQQSHWPYLSLLKKLVNVIASAINEKSLLKKMDTDSFPVCDW